MAAMRRRSSNAVLSLGLLVGALGAVSSCGERRYVANAETPNPACPRAGAQRARVSTLVAEGRLARAIRLMQRVESACPEEAPKTWADHVSALAALGRAAEAMTLADRIENSSRSDARALAAAGAARRAALEETSRRREARSTVGASREAFLRGLAASAAADPARAKEAFLEAWRKAPAHPRALVEAGLAARALGDGPGAQRLWDRAAFEDANQPIRPEMPHGAPTDAAMTRMAWSPDGSVLALSGIATITVFSKEVKPLERFFAGDPVTALALSPNGNDVFAGLANGQIKSWDRASGAGVRDFAGHAAVVTRVAVAPDGATMASAARDGSLRLWQTSTGTSARELRLPSGAATDLAFSHDGKTLAWSTERGHVGLLDATSFVVSTLPHARAKVLGVAFGPDAKTLTVVTPGARLRYDLERPRGQPKVVDKGVVELGALALRAAAPTFGLSRDGSVAIRELDTGAERAFAWADADGPLTIALAPQGRALAAAYAGHRLVVHSLDGKQHALTPPAPIEAVSATTGSLAIAAGAEDGMVHVWTTRPPRLLGLDGRGAHARAVAFSPDGATLATGAGEGKVLLWDGGGHVRASLELGEPVMRLAFSPDGRVVAAAGSAPSISVIDANNGASKGRLLLDGGAVRALSFGPDGASLLSASQEGLTLWDLATQKGSRYTAYGMAPRAVAWAPDGASFAVARADASLAIGSPGKTSPARVILLPGSLQALEFGPSGTLATAESDGSIALRSPTGKIAHKFRADGAAARAVTVSDGSIIAGFSDGSVRVFRPPREEAVVVLRAAPRAVAASAPGGSASGYVSAPSGHLDLLGDDLRGARSLLLCRLGVHLYPFEVCADQFVVPGLLGIALAGQDPAEAEP
jgi:WD40 repeat protein